MSYGMDTERTLQIDPAIFDTQSALHEYLLDVRLRRESRRTNRIEIQRLTLAIEAVAAELQAAQQDDDTEIVTELNLVLAEFKRRLATLQFPTLPIPTAVQSTLLLPPIIEPQTNDSARFDVTPTSPICSSQPCSERPNPMPPDSDLPQDSHYVAEQDLEPYTSESDDEEREAKICAWLAEIDTLAGRWNEIDSEGLRQKDKLLHRPACFRLRALACELAMIHAEALDSGLATHIQSAITGLRNKMDLARTYAGDTCPILPLDPRSWVDPIDRLAPMDWNELAQHYTDVAAAQEAWDWYAAHREDLVNQINLLNSIGAIQQMLFRTLDDFGGSDKLQMDLFGNLKAKAATVGFLNSLHADTHWDTLVQLANALPLQLERAMQEVLGAREKRERESRKVAAIQAVVHWEQEFDLPDTPISTKREQLLPLLDECIAAGIPVTNVQVRTALLNSAPALLHELPAYSKFLEAVVAERKRRGMDSLPSPEQEHVDSDEDLSEALISESLEWVRLLMQGQKVLILGGSSRPQVAQKLKEMIGCASVEWPDSKKGDRMNKFRTMIIHSDVLIVAKNFASHEMTEKSRDWAKELGKKFVFLPSGYGVNQIINQMNLQLIQTDKS